MHSDFIAKATTFKERKTEREKSQQSNWINEIIIIFQEFQSSQSRIPNTEKSRTKQNRNKQYRTEPHIRTYTHTHTQTHTHIDIKTLGEA